MTHFKSPADRYALTLDLEVFEALSLQSPETDVRDVPRADSG